MQQEKTSKEPILVISDIEFDNFSDIEVGDIVLLNDYVKAIADSIKSKNNMVIVKDIIQVQDYNNEAYISFENKNNEIESHPISLFKKLKTYSFSEINHKPGNLFFSLDEVSGIREKNIVYEEIDHKNFSKNGIFYKAEGGHTSSISRTKTVAFININNNLDIKWRIKMTESIFNTNSMDNIISKYNEIKNNIPSSIEYSIDEEIKEGDLIQYIGVDLARRGLQKSKITKCVRVEKNDFSQYKKIYYVRSDNGAIDWVNDIYFKKIKTERIDKNLKPNDYIISLYHLTGARDLYEVFPIYEIIRRDDNTIQSIEYLAKNNEIRRSKCNTFGENVGFLKLIQNSDINRFFTSNAYSDNSYISIIKNLIK